MTDPSDRLTAQIRFLTELDKLKSVGRQTWLLDGSRLENDAEHSWHVATMALVLGEHAAEPGVDMGRVVRMLLVHDLVEIDAGDTYLYDEAAMADKADREQAAADRIFALLPAEQGEALRALWEEYEAGETPEARFAASLDRLQPLLHNVLTEGRAWLEHGIHADQVLERVCSIADGSPLLWAYAQSLIDEAVERGYLLPPRYGGP
ncbi:MAG: HD domain-containing protein [Planctomycetota bacterium]